jgi:hypothetical protein
MHMTSIHTCTISLGLLQLLHTKYMGLHTKYMALGRLAVLTKHMGLRSHIHFVQ